MNFPSKTIRIIIVIVFTKSAATGTFTFWPDSDECVVGIMGKHILEQGVHPHFFYGQNDGGCASIEAHTAAIFCKLFGISNWSLKMAALTFTLLGAIITYYLTLSILGKRAALYTLIVYAVMPSLIIWGLKTRGGYTPILVFIPLILLLTNRIIRKPGVDHISALLLPVIIIISY